MEGNADPREGIVSDWDLLIEEFIVEAEDLVTLGIIYCIFRDSLAFYAQASLLSRTMIWISCVRSG